MNYQENAQEIEALIQKIAPNSRLLQTWPLTGGISAQMTAFEIESAGGQKRKLILRRPGLEAMQHNPHAARDQYRLLDILRSHGLAVPAPVYLDNPGETLPASYLVTEYIEGQITFMPPDTENYLFQMARNLAQIHNMDCSRLDFSFLEEAEQEVSAALATKPQALDHSLEEGRIREMLEAVWPIPERNPRVLLHGDYWPGNILWQQNQITAVIDWEDAQCGDPLKDFANSRLENLWIFGRDAMMIFTQHYQSMTTFDFASLPYWDLWAVLHFIQWAGPRIDDLPTFFLQHGRNDITEQGIRENVLFFIQQAFEKMA